MSGRTQLLVSVSLALVFLAPLALAWTVYYQPAWQPEAELQHGELLEPGRSLDIEGSSFDASLLMGRWTLLYSSAGRCEADCLALMAILRAVHLAQGREMRRVQRVLVEPAESAAVDEDIIRRDPGLLLVGVESWELPDDSLFLVDPQGNLVLRYHSGFAPMGLLKDLQRVLKMSRSG